MDLRLDSAELAMCVGCGLCLPHCPTFRVTGEEALSPRGRIASMRSVVAGTTTADDQFTDFMASCVQCRGCEPACPSGVPFGRLIEGTRAALTAAGRTTPWWQRLGYRILPHHRILLVGSTLLAVAQRARLVPAALGLTRLPIRRGPPVRNTGADVWLFTGCVMDAWQRPTHRATQRMIGRAGATSRVPHRGAGCCGALHVHAGLAEEARRLAQRVMNAMPGDAPILVNSAGCGAQLQDYGHLVGTPEAVSFSRRVHDIHEWLDGRREQLGRPARRVGSVVLQDPCHLRHVQKAHLPVRSLLDACATVVELDDVGLCCGAGGAYSALEPELAGQIRARKLAAIERARLRGGQTVASANPGWAMHLAAAGVTVRHPIDLLDDAYSP
jgi:glycolate oxidase iron-sulfur subunit